MIQTCKALDSGAKLIGKIFLLFPSFPFSGNPGITVNIDNNASILTYFELFFDDKILGMIVQETNSCAQQYIHKTVCKEGSCWKKWTEMNIEELRLFFVILFPQGVIKKSE